MYSCKYTERQKLQSCFPLVFKGEWIYRDRGILDKTHLRFFTKNTAIDIMNRGNLQVEKIIDIPIANKNANYFFKYSPFPVFKSLTTRQFAIRSRKISK